MKRFLPLVVALALAGLAGCLMQPKDARTGEPLGPPVSVATAPDGTLVDRDTGKALPATSPAGNPVVLASTAQVDYGRIADIVQRQVAPIATAVTPPPYQGLTGALIAAAVYELNRRREQKALNTPPPAGAPPPK